MNCKNITLTNSSSLLSCPTINKNEKNLLTLLTSGFYEINKIHKE